MTNIIAQPLGYGQDNIKDPLDKTPYTYRVNQLQDKAQFLSYLENPRFQRTLTIAGYAPFLQNTLSHHTPTDYKLPLIDTAHALDVDTSLFQDRYPYTTGDILGILIDKESNAPMQSSILNNNSNNNNNNSNTGSLTLTPDSNTNYTLLLTEQTTLSSLSSGSLTLMKDGLLQKKTLEEIAEGVSGGSDSQGNSLLYTDENCFIFNATTGEIIGYTCNNVDVVIPPKIMEIDVVSIGNSAFENKGITSIVIPNTIISIGNSVFTNNQITSIVIPNNTSHIGNNAFSNNQITSVIIGSGTLFVGSYAFFNNKITSVTFYGQTILGSGAFLGQENGLGNGIVYGPGGGYIKSAYINNTNSEFDKVNLPYYTNNENCFIFNDIIGEITGYKNTCIIDANIIIPSEIANSSVLSIGSSAFQNKGLLSVDIPNSVTSIGNYAFLGNQLTSINIPNSVTNIGNYAFYNNKLTHAIIGNSVTNIGGNAFQSNQLTSINIPNSVTNIGNYAFIANKLISINIPGGVTSIGANSFGNQINSLGNGTIYGPASGYIKDTYMNNTNGEFDKDKLPNYVDQ